MAKLANLQSADRQEDTPRPVAKRSHRRFDVRDADPAIAVPRAPSRAGSGWPVGSPDRGRRQRRFATFWAANGWVASITVLFRVRSDRFSGPETPPKPPMRKRIGGGIGFRVRPAKDRIGSKSARPAIRLARTPASVVPPSIRSRIVAPLCHYWLSGQSLEMQDLDDFNPGVDPQSRRFWQCKSWVLGPSACAKGMLRRG